MTETRTHSEISKAELNDFFFQVPAPLCVLMGKSFVFTSANEAFKNLFGSQVIGRTVQDVLVHNDPKCFSETLNQVFVTGNNWVGKEIALNLGPPPNISKVLVNIHCQPIREKSGKVKGLMCFVENVTDLVLARQNMEEKEREIKKALEIAEAANRAKTDFLANMSHEIRTPLGAILGFSELLRDLSISNEDRIFFSETISRNGHLLSQLVNDILDLSKVESGKFEPELVPTSMSQIIEDLQSLFLPVAQKKNIFVRFSISSEVPEHILTDPIRLRQILVNLISNAIKFTDQGGIFVDVQTSPVTKKLCIQVKDTGIGISPAGQKRLFKTFSQADSSTTRRFGGTGLGLVLARKLARLLGGDVELVQSGLKQGATFCVTVDLVPTSIKLPLKGEQLDLDSSFSPEKGEFDGLKHLHDFKILLVEDSLDNQWLIKKILSKYRPHIDTAENGVVGVEKALQNSYDLVLMDVQMPVLDGIEAVRQLRTSGYLKPIVALTAHAMREDKERCLQAGFNTYLTKPLNIKDLLKTLASYCHHH